jgi:hypothetical protein
MRLILVLLGAEIFDGFLGTGSAVSQFIEHGVHHTVVQLLIFFIGPVGQGADEAPGAGNIGL